MFALVDAFEWKSKLIDICDFVEQSLEVFGRVVKFLSFVFCFEFFYLLLKIFVELVKHSSMQITPEESDLACVQKLEEDLQV